MNATIVPGFASAVWPASGIALAALLGWSRRYWPGVWLGAALANYSIGASPILAAVIATGSTLAALGARSLVRLYIAAPLRFDSPARVLQFAGIAAGCSLISATTGVVALFQAGILASEDFALNWYAWWLGDTTGVILFAPLLLAWATKDNAKRPQPGRLEYVLFSLLLLCAILAIFGGSLRPVVARSLTFVLFPFFAWAGCRFSMRFLTSIIAFVYLVATWAAIQQLGPYRIATLGERLLVLDSFTATVTLMGLTLFALTRARDGVERALLTSRDGLAVVVDDLRRQAMTDSLTGLYNSRYMSEFLQHELIRAARSHAPLAVVLADLDQFKRMNDSFGREAGDFVLVQCAALFRGNIRGSDIACRYGGEEFVLVLPGADRECALRRTESIKESIAKLDLEFGGQKLAPLTFSFGIALYPDHAETTEALIHLADYALHKAKRLGRNCVIVNNAKSYHVQADAPNGA